MTTPPTLSVVAIVRTKGEAPYLKMVVQQFLNAHIRVFIVDNNKDKTWECLADELVDYEHDPTDYIPMCTNDFADICYGQDKESCIATMYNNAFDQSRYPGAWLLKLDDDDYWTSGAIFRLQETLRTMSPKGIIYFSGVNLLSYNTISKNLSFCGGRDHFCVGPSVEIRFRNGKQWEEAIFTGVKMTKFMGLTYAHLKFFGDSLGYTKDIRESSKEFLTGLEKEIKIARPVTHLNSLFLRISSIFIYPIARIMKNKYLGMINAKTFYNELKESDFQTKDLN